MSLETRSKITQIPLGSLERVRGLVREIIGEIGTAGLLAVAVSEYERVEKIIHSDTEVKLEI